MRKRAGWLALALGAVAAGAWAQANQAIRPSSTRAPPSASAGPASATTAASYRSFAFTHLVVKLPDNQVYETYRLGAFCLGNYTKTWHGGQAEQKISAASTQAVREEMRAAGLKIDGDGENIFEKATPDTSETELGAIIDSVNFNYCLRPRYGTAAATSYSITGVATMSIEWQVYDKLSKTVLAKIRTDSGYEISTPTEGNSGLLFSGVFRENARKLAASQAFRTALLTPEGANMAAAAPTNQDPIPLTGAIAAGARPMGDAVASVVMIYAGQAQGSGFLVSSDGMLLTDRHVVGDAKYVKVRWSDGIEGLGEVLRSDKVRDVALVKTDPRGRKPLALRREPLQPGDTVYAIGAPMGDRFQGTVTRGVVSAYRTFDGLSYIQSDVNVNHGSSGGPLLDEKGEAVGVAELGAQIAGAPLGLNLFTPVRDALDFLSAQPK